jgi:hypothetical protein
MIMIPILLLCFLNFISFGFAETIGYELSNIVQTDVGLNGTLTILNPIQKYGIDINPLELYVDQISNSIIRLRISGIFFFDVRSKTFK